MRLFTMDARSNRLVVPGVFSPLQVLPRAEEPPRKGTSARDRAEEVEQGDFVVDFVKVGGAESAETFSCAF